MCSAGARTRAGRDSSGRAAALTSAGGPAQRPRGEQLCEPLHRAPVARRPLDSEHALEVGEVQLRAAGAVRIAEVDLAATDVEGVGRRAVGVELRDGGLRGSLLEERDVERLRVARLTAPRRTGSSRRRPSAPPPSGRGRRPRSRSSRPSSRCTSFVTAASLFDEEKRTLPLCSTVLTSSSPTPGERLAQLRHRDAVPAADVDGPEEGDVARSRALLLVAPARQVVDLVQLA